MMIDSSHTDDPHEQPADITLEQLLQQMTEKVFRELGVVLKPKSDEERRNDPYLNPLGQLLPTSPHYFVDLSRLYVRPDNYPEYSSTVRHYTDPLSEDLFTLATNAIWLTIATFCQTFQFIGYTMSNTVEIEEGALNKVAINTLKERMNDSERIHHWDLFLMVEGGAKLYAYTMSRYDGHICVALSSEEAELLGQVLAYHVPQVGLQLVT